MPLVRIDLSDSTDLATRHQIADIVHEAMVTTLNVPQDDRFQIISVHQPENRVIDANYLGIARTNDTVIIQITLNDGRSVDQKRAFYRKVADDLHERLNIRKEDVLISLIEVRKENWSFGNGEAQYAS
jgi:4-oxalocrotonate tautomerase